MVVATNKGYKFRIYPTEDQARQMRITFGCSRYVYNYYLNKRKEYYETTGETFNLYKCTKDLTVLKECVGWLYQVDSTALYSSVFNLDYAYQRFFDRVMKGEYPGFPCYKAKRDKKRSYTTTGRVKISDGHIRIPVIGNVKCSISKEVKGHINFATISQNPSGKYFISVHCTDVEIDPLSKTGKRAGIDLGINDLIVTSDGTHIENQMFYERSLKRLAILRKELFRKPKNSNNHEKARIKLAKLHEHIVNQRKDAIHKITTNLVRNYDLICIEDLDVQGMRKGKFLARKINNASFGEIRRQLEYKCSWYGKSLVKVGRYYPSSQTCGVCGFINKKLKNIHVRDWTCPNCTTYHNRDENAAKNILNEGIRIITSAS